jgi:hypothetical protein
MIAIVKSWLVAALFLYALNKRELDERIKKSEECRNKVIVYFSN